MCACVGTAFFHQAHSNKDQMKTLAQSMFILTVVATALSACGGGGNDSSTSSSGKAATSSSIAQIGGTYVMPCKGTTFAPSPDPTAAKSESETATIVITPDANGQATISAHRQIYINSATCEAGAIDFDLTFLGTAVDKSGNKTYTNAAGKPVTASVATIAYTGFKFSKGNLDFKLPAAGATTNMAYVIENNTLYLSKGKREADGLGDSLTPGAVRQ